MGKKQFDRQLNARIRELTATRDKLEKMVEDAEDFLSACDDAIESLESARDRLSELV